MSKKPPIRTAGERDAMREAGRIAADVLKRTAACVRAGVSTRDVDQAAADFMQALGCRSAFLGYRKFPGHICISLNEEIVHGIGSPKRIIQNGDIVKIDVGIVKDGWIGDNATTVPVGAIRPEVNQLLRATEDSLDIAVELAQPGAQLRPLCASVDKYVTRFGYSTVKGFAGHGVGRNLHEAPSVPNYDDKTVRERLLPGMIIAIEPMVNMGTDDYVILSDRWTAITRDRKPSAHFEHTVLVTENGPEVLTPRERLTTTLRKPATVLS